MAKNDFWGDVSQAIMNGAMFYLGYTLTGSEKTEPAEILATIFNDYKDREELSERDVDEIKNKLIQYQYGVNDGIIEQLFASWKKIDGF